MREWRRTRVSGLTGSLAALVTALVLGILGMHALDLHGTQHPDMPAGMSMGDASGSDDGAVDSAISTASDGAGQHGMGDMLMLCAAMLAAAAAVVLFRPGRRGILLAASSRRTGRLLSARLADAVAGAGPPHVWNFSVIRC